MRPFALALVVGAIALVVGAVPAVPREWEVLGPLPWGMRELGGDPLGAYVPGGIAALPFPAPAELRIASELADGGTIGPSTAAADDGGDGTVRVTFGDDVVRWEFNRQFFSWTANQWQAWARAALRVDAVDAGTYAVRCASVGEFAIGDQTAHGDWYAYGDLWRRVELAAGTHVWRVRLASEVRLFGGALPPTVAFRCVLRDVRGVTAFVLDQQQIFPDVLAATGALVTAPAGVGVFNADGDTIAVVGAAAANGSSPVRVTLLGSAPVRIASGQARRIALELSSDTPIAAPFSLQYTLDVLRADGTRATIVGSRNLAFRDATAATRLTFVDYDGSVQYTMVKRPLSRCPVTGGCPPIVTLHGAGVEASSGAWTDAYPPQQHAWVVYPTGRTPWGYDWHGASRLTVERSLDAAVAYAGADQIDASRVLITGHSNGGQGCWYMASHYPDRYVAANPAAGYIKIQFYVPFFWRPGDAHVDPPLRAVLETAIAEFDTDLYTPNLVGLPLIARTGGADDNVPPVHSRRLVRMLNELNGAAGTPPLSEVPGQGHYYDGIMTDGDVGALLQTYTQPNASLPAFPSIFSLVTLNPASSGARGGIRIEQLRVPGRAARVRVEQRTPTTWLLATENVRRLHVSLDDARMTASVLVIDGAALAVGAGRFCRLGAPDTPWQACDDDPADWPATERSPTSSGPVLQVYDGPLLIVVGTRGAADELRVARDGAATIANDWLHHGNGNVEIVTDMDALERGDLAAYNLLVLGGPAVNALCAAEFAGRPVVFGADGRTFSIAWRSFADASTGALFTAPWKTGLAVIAAGTDADGLRLALEQFPVRTGTTVPDFVVVGKEQPWKGAGGVLGAGLWSYDWSFSEASGYLR